MTSKERKDVWNTGKDNGWRPSSYDSSKLVNGHGSSISFPGSNRTIVDHKTYYGAHAAKNAINGNN